MEGPIDYVSGLGAIPNIVDNFKKAVAFKAGLAAQQAEIADRQAAAQQASAAASQIAEKQARQQMFTQDLGTVQANPSPKNVSDLMMKYPEFAEQIKGAWNLKDTAQRDADLTSIGQVYSPALSGDWATAQKAAHDHYDADKAAGKVTPEDDQFIQQVDAAASGDKTAQKTVLTALGLHAAAAAGPDHFASVYGAMNNGGFTLDAGATRYDNNGNVIAESPLLKGADGTIYEKDGANGTVPSSHAPPSSKPGGDQGFNTAIAFTLKHEGGYNPHDMNGAAVNFGINQGANPSVDVKNLTQPEAVQIYKTKYWDKSGAANLPAAMQTPYFDTYIINPERAEQFLKASGGDPAKFMAMRESWMDSVAAKHPQYAKAYATRNADLRLTLQGASSAPDDGTPTADGAPPGYHTLVPGNANPDQYRTLTADEAKAKGLDPNQTYQLNTKTGQVTSIGQGTGDPVASVLQQYHIAPDETGPSVLAKLPPNLAARVKQMVEGRAVMPTGNAAAKPYFQMLMGLASQVDPSWDANTAAARKAAITAFTGNGKGAQIVGSVNRVANHLNLLYNESQKLAGPDTGNSALNSLVATVGQSFEPQDARAYDTEVGFVAGELGKIAKAGVVTEGEIDRIISNLSRKQSASTREAAIKAAVGIISGAIDPLKDQYNSAFPNNVVRPNVPWVTPKAQQIYKQLGGDDMSLTGSSADTNAANDSTGVVHIQTAEQWNALKPGTKYIDPTGVARIKH